MVCILMIVKSLAYSVALRKLSHPTIHSLYRKMKDLIKPLPFPSMYIFIFPFIFIIRQCQSGIKLKLANSTLHVETRLKYLRSVTIHSNLNVQVGIITIPCCMLWSFCPCLCLQDGEEMQVTMMSMIRGSIWGSCVEGNDVIEWLIIWQL